jgi:hypothetical protein
MVYNTENVIITLLVKCNHHSVHKLNILSHYLAKNCNFGSNTRFDNYWYNWEVRTGKWALVNFLGLHKQIRVLIISNRNGIIIVRKLLFLSQKKNSFWTMELLFRVFKIFSQTNQFFGNCFISMKDLMRNEMNGKENKITLY